MNDNAPKITCPLLPQALESTPIGTAVLQCSATDADIDQNAVVSYSFDRYVPYLFLDSVTGVATVQFTMDRESIPFFNFSVIATDQGYLPLATPSPLVEFIVLDVNDNPPVFSKPSYSFSVAENAAVGLNVGQLHATDADIGINTQFAFSIVNGSTEAEEAFSIDPLSGVLTVALGLDRERVAFYTLLVQVTDIAAPFFATQATVSITILDINDNTPTFDFPLYQAYLLEAQTTIFLIAHVQTTDADLGLNGTAGTTYALAPQSDPRFAIDPQTGSVLVTAPVYYNDQTLITLAIIATDGCGAVCALSSTTLVNITILPSDLHSPIFGQASYRVSVDEFVPIGTPINITLQATDQDKGGHFGDISFELQDMSSTFSVDNVTGVISTAKLLDWNVQKVYVFSVLATDPAGRFDIAYVVVNITYNLLHVNPIFISPLYTVTIYENLPLRSVLPVSIHAVDSVNSLDSPFKYFIFDADSEWFAIDSSSGNISAVGNVDREAIADGAHLYLVVGALFEPNGRIAYTRVVVTVLDVNDNIPAFYSLYNISVYENLTIGSVMMTLRANDPDLGINSLLSFKLLALNIPFVVDASSGAVVLNSGLDREAMDYYGSVVQVMDGGGLYSNSSFTLTVLDVNDNAPVLVSANCPSTSTSLSIVKDAKSNATNITINSFPETYCLPSTSCQDSRTVLIPVFTDADIGLNAQLFFVLDGTSPYVAVNRTSGVMYLVAPVDREQMENFGFNIIVSDMGYPPQKTLIRVTVHLADLNDNLPILRPVPQIVISEAVGPASLALLTADDADMIPVNSLVTYTISAVVPPTNTFYVSRSDSGVSTASGVSRVLASRGPTFNSNLGLTSNIYTLNITAANLQAAVSLSTSLQVSVKLLPFINQLSTPDASTVLLSWQFPGVCRGSLLGECSQLFRREVASIDAELWVRRSFACDPLSCPLMSTSVISPSVCDCRLYGPGTSDYNTSLQSYTVPNLAASRAYGFQLRLFSSGGMIQQSSWYTKVVDSYNPTNLSIDTIGANLYNVSWAAPPSPNGAVLGYRVCYCLQESIPLSACTCTNTFPGVRSSPEDGYTTRTRAFLPDPASSTTLELDTNFFAVVELTTTLSNGKRFIARSDAVTFTTHTVPTSSSTVLSGGGVAGLVIGLLIFVALVAVLVVLVIRRRRQTIIKQQQPLNVVVESNILGTAPRGSNMAAPLLAGRASADQDGYWDYFSRERAEQFMPADTKVMVSADEPDTMESAPLPITARASPDGDGESLSSLMVPSRNFGLRSAHVLADKTVGELLPRTDSRSSPLVPRRRTLSIGSSLDPLTRRLNGDDADGASCRTVGPSFSNDAKKWKMNGTLDREFEELKQQSTLQEHDFKAAKESFNQRKNRYMNVLPPESARVRLSHSGVLGSDYVNANYVDGFRERKRYIATQGPLPATVQDFWRMVWEENCGVVVNTTSLEEGGKVKCHKYWPEVDATIQCGTLEVVCEETKPLGSESVHRTLSLRNSKTNQRRTVAHLSFEAWPDHGVPTSPAGILLLLKTLASQRELSQKEGVTGPIVVHCSAGIGRTGVLCVLDMCLQRLREMGSVDVQASALHMRRQRPGAVQTLLQYLFIYDALALHVADTQTAGQPESSPVVSSSPGAGPLTAEEMQQLVSLGAGAEHMSLQDMLQQLSAL